MVDEGFDQNLNPTFLNEEKHRLEKQGSATVAIS